MCAHVGMFDCDCTKQPMQHDPMGTPCDTLFAKVAITIAQSDFAITTAQSDQCSMIRWAHCLTYCLQRERELRDQAQQVAFQRQRQLAAQHEAAAHGFQLSPSAVQVSWHRNII